ncbi:hypothetical protein [Streptomyces sp. NPDC003032]
MFSSFLRSAAVMSLAALALTAGASASTASAAPAPANATAPAPTVGHLGHPDPDFHHHHHPPLNFGPFQVPSNGSVSGGFAWNAR